MYNGYEYVPNQAPVHWLDVDFSLAGGFFCDFSNWQFTTSNNLPVDPNTGFPSVGTDWNSLVINPMRNQWKVSILISNLPLPCFDMTTTRRIGQSTFGTSTACTFTSYRLESEQQACQP